MQMSRDSRLDFASMAASTMKFQLLFLSLNTLFSLLTILPHSIAAAPIGLCYGRVANNLPPPSSAISLITSNGISRIRLFNPNPEALQPFSGTGIELMIGIPNEVLPTLAAGNVDSSKEWLQSNLFAYVSPNQVRYLAVGNEIFLKDTFYIPHLLPAINNLHQAIVELGFAQTIKLSSSHAASILSNSYPPSAGSFDPTILPVLTPLLQFLRDTGSPLMVNVYPYFSYIGSPQYVSLDYALFRPSTPLNDNGLVYENLFDQTLDSFVYAMEREGFLGIPVVVSETGWPTTGGDAASIENALAFNGNIVKRVLNNVGTPKRPGSGVEVFLFDLYDENEKSGPEFEKHFGMFGVDGVKAYDINFS